MLWGVADSRDTRDSDFHEDSAHHQERQMLGADTSDDEELLRLPPIMQSPGYAGMSEGIPDTSDVSDDELAPYVVTSCWTLDDAELQVRATREVDPDDMGRPQIERWVRESANDEAHAAVSRFAARMDSALLLASDWIRDRSQKVADAGWSVLETKAQDLTDDDIERLLAHAERRAASQKPRGQGSRSTDPVDVGSIRVTLGVLAALRELRPDLSDRLDASISRIRQAARRSDPR